jgi:tetratricopeptide (TPR) repeat protein
LDHSIEYKYDIHKSIGPSLAEQSLSWKYLDAPIQHFDFLDVVAGKRDRYRRMLKNAIDRGDDLPFLKTIYAIELFAAKQYEEAHSQVSDAIKLVPTEQSRLGASDNFPRFFQNLFFLVQGARARARDGFGELLLQGTARTESDRSRYMGETYLALGALETLEGNYESALQCTNESISQWKSAEALFSRATLHAHLRRRAMAFEDIMEGLSLNPMAGDPRILKATHPETVFEFQCILNPMFKGLDKLWIGE